MKIIKKSSDSNRGLHGAHTLQNEEVNHLVGELLTIIDAIGLKGSQEKSLKDLIKQKIWGTMDSTFFINGKILILAKDVDWQLRDENQQLNAKSTSKEEREKGLHPKWIEGDYELTFVSTE